jgi:hypothetical protein
MACLQDPADDDVRVGTQTIDDQTSPETGEIVRADHRIAVARADKIGARFVLEEVLDASNIFQRPLHVCHQPSLREASGTSVVERFFEQGQHGVLVEITRAEVRVLPAAHVELAVALSAGRVQPDPLEPLNLVVAPRGVHNVAWVWRSACGVFSGDRSPKRSR